jgi:hypothetical protein
MGKIKEIFIKYVNGDISEEEYEKYVEKERNVLLNKIKKCGKGKEVDHSILDSNDTSSPHYY